MSEDKTTKDLQKKVDTAIAEGGVKKKGDQISPPPPPRTMVLKLDNPEQVKMLLGKCNKNIEVEIEVLASHRGVVQGKGVRVIDELKITAFALVDKPKGN